MEGKKQGLLEPLPVTRQLVFRWDAQAAIGQHPDNLFYICLSIKRLISDPNVTDKPLRDYYKDKFENAKKILNTAHHVATHVKSYYDSLKGKSIIEPDVDSKQFRLFARYNMQLPRFYLPIFEMYYVLLKATILSNLSITSEAFAEAKRQYKSFEIDETEVQFVKKKDKEEFDDDED